MITKNSRLFELAHGVRFPHHWTYPAGVLVYAVMVPFIAAFCQLPFLLAASLSGAISIEGLFTSSTSYGVALRLLASFLPFFFLVWGWLWLFERRKPSTIGLESTGWLRKYLRGLFVGLCLFGIIVGIQFLLGGLKIEIDPATPTGRATLGSVFLVLIGWTIQGAAEEVLARGFVLPVIGLRWGVFAGILTSSLLFAMLHLLNPGLNPLAILNLTLFGVFAALYALREGGLWGVFALHSAWNWTQGNLFGLPVSGMATGGSLFNLQATGPDWLTGGAFGPEGGLAVTAVLIIACLLTAFARLPHRPSHNN
jgi:membrane protease YdiL (CAAX protease family)